MFQQYRHAKFAERFFLKLLLGISPLILNKRREEVLHEGNSSFGKDLF